MMMAAPRVYAKMADDGLLPSSLRIRKGAPRQAVAAQVLLAVVFILISSLRGLLSYLGLTLSLCAVCSVGCLFLPSVRRQAFHRMSYGRVLGVEQEVSRIVMGTLGSQELAQASVMFDDFTEAGGNCFDTARHYGPADLVFVLWMRNR